MRSLSVVDGQPRSFLAGTNSGVLWTSDRGNRWEWICEEAIGYGQNDIPVWTMTQTGAMFAAALKGLYVSRDRGCTWTSHPAFAASGAKDIQRGPGGTLYVTTGRYTSANGLFISHDDGVTFEPTMVSSDKLFMSSVRPSPSRPERIYVAAWWFEAPATSLLYVSDDSGKTFAAQDVGGPQGGGGPFNVLAVHPTNPDFILAALTHDAADRPSFLLRSENGGMTFEKILTGPDAFGSAAFNSDGTAWAATGRSLFRSTDGAKTFTVQEAPHGNACVQTRGAETFACGASILDGWGIGVQSPSCPDSWEALFRYERVVAVRSCAQGTPVYDVCTPLLPALQAAITVDGEYDAGCGQTSLGDGGNSDKPRPKGCGCGYGSSLPAWVLLGLLWPLLMKLKTRRPKGGLSFSRHP